MFNTLKKAVGGLFGVRAVAKPRRNVIALPTVDTAAESEEALVDARRGLLAVLEEILQGKKDAESEAIDRIVELLDEGFLGEWNGYPTYQLQDNFRMLKIKYPWWGCRDARWCAFAAAIEYFAGCFPVDVQTLEYALKVIDSGNYRHIAEYDCNGYSCGVGDDDSLGRFIANKKIDCDAEGFEYLEGYFDFEACGRDYRTATNGKFTQYGFFAEL